MKVLLVDGTIVGRKTGAILEQVKMYIQEFQPEMELVILSLADYEHQFVDGRPLGEYNESMQEIARRFNDADGYIIATPIFQGSIPGVLKTHSICSTRVRCAINPYRLSQMAALTSTTWSSKIS